MIISSDLTPPTPSPSCPPPFFSETVPAKVGFPTISSRATGMEKVKNVNFYGVLSLLSEKATAQEIKMAYKTLARWLHPQRVSAGEEGGVDEGALVEVNMAYEALRRTLCCAGTTTPSLGWREEKTSAGGRCFRGKYGRGSSSIWGGGPPCACGEEGLLSLDDGSGLGLLHCEIQYL